MRIGLAGYQGSGKSTLFQWLTGVAPDPAKSHLDQSAMAPIPEPRMEDLIRLYSPKKVTYASIEITDTPGLSRTPDGNAAKLACIREADSLVLVVAGFGGLDPKAEYQKFYEDLTLADMELVTKRMERVEETLGRRSLSKDDRERFEFERDTLVKINEGLASGEPIQAAAMDEDELRVLAAFRLFTQKSCMVLVNTADDEQDPDRFRGMLGDKIKVLAAPVALMLELTTMSPEEGAALVEEMELKNS